MSAKREKNERRSRTYWLAQSWLPSAFRCEGSVPVDHVPSFDSMPQNVLKQWREELARESEDFEDELRYRIDSYLDRGVGSRYLSNERIAQTVQAALLHFDGERYRLVAWVVMPNHVRLLVAPCFAHTQSSIMHSLKSYTAQQANKMLQRKGRFWFEDYFDRYIRNVKHFENAVGYIESNPVRAGLCKSSRDWRFSGASYSPFGGDLNNPIFALRAYAGRDARAPKR